MNPFTKIEIIQYRNNSSSEVEDYVASEKRLRIYSNNKEILSLMCTPTMIRELVVGFGLSEGLIKYNEHGDLQQEWCTERIEIFWKDQEIKVQLPIQIPDISQTLTSGCAKGVTFSLNTEIEPIRDDFEVDINTIIGLYKEFQKKSQLFRSTGGVHSAALCNEKEILIFAEDIGRHNAIDKVIGYAFLENIPLQKKLLLTSGRLSSEIVNKAVRARVPLLISRAAPTDMAIKLADKYRVTLVGFLRGRNLNIYSNPQRIRQ
jgi:FdhD protein